MTVFCEECKHLKDCELAKHEEVDTCKKGESMTDTEKKDIEELKERVEVLENQIQILYTEYKKLSGFNSLNQKYR